MQQKCFEVWRNARYVQQEKADKLRRKQMLQKGISALRFAVNQHKQSAVEVQTRTSARIMAKYWLKVRNKTPKILLLISPLIPLWGNMYIKHHTLVIRCLDRGVEWSFKNRGSHKIFVKSHRSCILVFLAVTCLTVSIFCKAKKLLKY